MINSIVASVQLNMSAAYSYILYPDSMSDRRENGSDLQSHEPLLIMFAYD